MKTLKLKPKHDLQSLELILRRMHQKRAVDYAQRRVSVLDENTQQLLLDIADEIARLS